MRLSRLYLAVVLSAGCASSLSQPGMVETRPEFQSLNGIYEVNVRLYSQEAMSGSLALLSSDTVRGIYTGVLTLEGIEFDGDVVAYRADSPLREVQAALVEHYNAREAGRAYAYLLLSATDRDGLGGHVRIYSASRPCLTIPRRHVPPSSSEALLERNRCPGSRGQLHAARRLPVEAT